MKNENKCAILQVQELVSVEIFEMLKFELQTYEEWILVLNEITI